jgi:predicted dehydrogenase
VRPKIWETHTHHDIVLAAAAAGKAVFCEKPIALTLTETDSTLATVEKAGVLFQVGFMRRFDKGFAAAKRKVEVTLQIGYLRDTPVLTLTPDGVSHAVVAWFEERFTPAYHAQLDHFIDCIRQDKPPLAGAVDARRALEISLAATRSQRERRPITIATPSNPGPTDT